MTAPLVTALLPTCARFPDESHLLAESVESFLRQTYEPKHLLILNDAPGQVLAFDHPQVTVVNLPRRFPTLTEKWFAGARLCASDLICPWDDDDVCLPHRIAQSVEQLGDLGFWMPPSLWFWWDREQRLEAQSLISFDTGIVRRDALLAVESIAGRQPVASDWSLADALLRNEWTRLKFNQQRERPPGLERFYIYRRGVSTRHLSGSGRGDAEHFAEVGEGAVQGEWRIEAGWSRDWVGMCSEASEETNMPIVVRNAKLDSIESTIYPFAERPTLSVRTGDDSGTVLATLSLPSDWMADAPGNWQDTPADADGTAIHRTDDVPKSDD